MVDLFRYIEQAFVVPTGDNKAINVSDSSDFQNKLRSSIQQKKDNLEVRKEAENFIEKNQVSDKTFKKIAQQ
jgi:hypothetical protein